MTMSEVADKVRADGVAAVVLVGDAHDAVDAALKGHGRRGHARRAHQPRRRLFDAAALELVAVRLESGRVDSFAQLVA